MKKTYKILTDVNINFIIEPSLYEIRRAKYEVNYARHKWLQQKGFRRFFENWIGFVTGIVDISPMDRFEFYIYIESLKRWEKNEGDIALLYEQEKISGELARRSIRYIRNVQEGGNMTLYCPFKDTVLSLWNQFHS